MIQLKGLDGCLQRMAELEARFGANPTMNRAVVSVNAPQPAPPPGVKSAPGQASLSGPVDGAGHAGPPTSGSFSEQLDKAHMRMAPLDPMAAGGNLVPVSPKSSTEAIRSLAVEAARQNGVDPALFQALVQTESDFNPRLVSSAGAMGLTQLMPKTAQQLGVSDPFDAAQNLNGGAKYLSQLMKQFGDPSLALAAYNAGPGAVTRAGGIPPFAETKDYVAKVLSRARDLRSQ